MSRSSFEGTTTSTATPSRRRTTAGEVLVVNFWYASCAPCRAEAPTCEDLEPEFADEGVSFLGVNVRDQADTALAFDESYGITYPSIIDVNDGGVQLAFGDDGAAERRADHPGARPRGSRRRPHPRPAQDESILRTLIRDTIAEAEVTGSLGDIVVSGGLLLAVPIALLAGLVSFALAVRAAAGARLPRLRRRDHRTRAARRDRAVRRRCCSASRCSSLGFTHRLRRLRRRCSAALGVWLHPVRTRP